MEILREDFAYGGCAILVTIGAIIISRILKGVFTRRY